jgi:hypothetical protein
MPVALATVIVVVAGGAACGDRRRRAGGLVPRDDQPRGALQKLLLDGHGEPPPEA